MASNKRQINGNTKQKSFVKPKNVPAVYNKIEQLIQSLFKTLDNVPNKPCIHAAVTRLANECLECATATSYAYLTKDYSERLDYLYQIGVHLMLIETIIRVLTGHTTGDGKYHIMTESKMCEYLAIITDIEIQIDKWKTSTENHLNLTQQSVGNGFNQTKGSGVSEDFSIPENTTYRPLEQERQFLGEPVWGDRLVMDPFKSYNPFVVDQPREDSQKDQKM